MMVTEEHLFPHWASGSCSLIYSIVLLQRTIADPESRTHTDRKPIVKRLLRSLVFLNGAVWKNAADPHRHLQPLAFIPSASRPSSSLLCYPTHCKPSTHKQSGHIAALKWHMHLAWPSYRSLNSLICYTPPCACKGICLRIASVKLDISAG